MIFGFSVDVEGKFHFMVNVCKKLQFVTELIVFAHPAIRFRAQRIPLGFRVDSIRMYQPLYRILRSMTPHGRQEEFEEIGLTSL